MADTPKHSVSVAGIVVDNQDRVLVIQRRDNGHWEAPGGVLELGETPEQGVQREVFEETGVHVEVDFLTGVYKNMPRAIVSLVFRCHPLAGSASISDEAADVAWLDLPEAESNMDAAYAVRVRDAFSHGRTPVRAHDGTNVIAAAPSSAWTTEPTS